MLWGTILPTDDPHRLADFYAGLLGWVIAAQEPGWVRLEPPGGGTAYLGFQLETSHVPPPWPPADGQTTPVMQFAVPPGQVPGTIAYAVSLGARVPDEQPDPAVTILLDPSGHPFTLGTNG